MSATMKDWRGTEITHGATVLYGTASGSSGVNLKVACVLSLRPGAEAPRKPYAPVPEDKVWVQVVAQNRGVEVTKTVYVSPHLLTVVRLP